MANNNTYIIVNASDIFEPNPHGGEDVLIPKNNDYNLLLNPRTQRYNKDKTKVVAKYRDTPDFLDEDVVTYSHSEILVEMEKDEWQ